MADLNFFGKDKTPANRPGSGNKNFNVIIADTQWETFEALSDIMENYNFLNLSSEFAVNFILDYEKIDIIIIGLKIGGLEAISKKAERKKVKVYVLGRDLSYPVVKEEVLSTIKKECNEKITLKKSGSARRFMGHLEKIFGPRVNANAVPDNLVEHATVNIRPGNKKHSFKKITNKSMPDIWFSKTEDTNNEPSSIKSENTTDPRTEHPNTIIADIFGLKTENINTVDASTGIEDFGDACTETANRKDTNAEHTNIGNANIENTTNKPAGIVGKSTDPSDAEFSGNDDIKNELIGHKSANIKDGNMKSDKEQNKKNQFYNDFWKEVATEASESYLDIGEIRKPNRNMYEYGKKDEDSYKQHLTDIPGKQNEGLVPSAGKVITVKQKIMVFVKAKGGVGSTFLSLYLAYEFRKLRTLLIDLNFSEGGSDTGYYLGMPKSPNMVIFTEGYNRASMENSVINFRGYFDVLQPPPSYDLTKRLDMQDIYSIVDIAKKKYHLLIFDLPNQIDDIFFGVLDMADLTIMVSDYTPGSIGRLASINKRFIYNDMEKILVLNKNKNNNSHNFIKNNISEFISLEEIVNIDENSILSGKSDFKECDFLNNKDMQGFKNKVMESLTCD